MKCLIADFKIEIENCFDYIYKSIKKYNYDSPDFKIKNTKTEISNLVNKNSSIDYMGYTEHIETYRKIAEWLPLHNAFVLHSATFDVDGAGVAFAAHSGTGKTTHMLLWQKLLGERMTIVNGDKPIVRFFDGEPTVPYAYGTPWRGKENYGCNMRTPIKHICFIERSEKNFVEKLQPSEIINLIFNQVYMPKDPKAVAATMQLINRFIGCCELWRIHCNMDISAAETAYRAIFKEI